MKNKLKHLLLLVTLASLPISLCACTGDTANSGSPEPTGTAAQTGEPSLGGSVTVAIAQDLDDTLDPHLAVSAGTEEVLFNLFEGLVKPDPEGELIPAVASDFDISEDGTTYTFTVREGIAFHNGDLVTVEDVVYSLNRIAGTESGTPLVSAFSLVKSIEAPDDQTVVITLSEGNIEFLSYLTEAVIPADYDNQGASPVGTGPFKFVSRTPQEGMVMERFDGYWGTPAYLDQVEYKVITNADTLMMSLKSGAVDLCAHLTATQVRELGNSFKIESDTMKLVQALYLNNAVEPFDDVKVRQALCYAVDIQEILELTADGEGVPVGSSMYPAFQKYFMSELAEAYPKDVEKATTLLAEAGYPDGFDMTITVPSNYTPHVNVAQVLEQQFKAIGVNATIELVEWETWVERVYQGREFQSTVVGLDASSMTARAMLERFESGNAKNFINFKDSEYDEVFVKAISSTDDEEQVGLYQRLQEILSQQAANVYLQDLCDFVAISPELDGLTFYPIYVLDMSTIYYVA